MNAQARRLKNEIRRRIENYVTVDEAMELSGGPDLTDEQIAARQHAFRMEVNSGPHRHSINKILDECVGNSKGCLASRDYSPWIDHKIPDNSEFQNLTLDCNLSVKYISVTSGFINEQVANTLRMWAQQLTAAAEQIAHLPEVPYSTLPMAHLILNSNPGPEQPACEQRILSSHRIEDAEEIGKKRAKKYQLETHPLTVGLDEDLDSLIGYYTELAILGLRRDITARRWALQNEYFVMHCGAVFFGSPFLSVAQAVCDAACTPFDMYLIYDPNETPGDQPDEMQIEPEQVAG